MLLRLGWLSLRERMQLARASGLQGDVSANYLLKKLKSNGQVLAINEVFDVGDVDFWFKRLLVLLLIIKGPADGEGELDAFVSIITGPPGPNPVQLMPRITLLVLILWGDQDTFTPLDGPVEKYFSSLPSQSSNISLFVLKGVGHCPHDDRPDLVMQSCSLGWQIFPAL
ncbi:hypothetical protein GIB67_041432 [Kingdonia uniflora]|uniref:Uncharacterized protein n=1 Tax=Kingdonia uniflora TaxID=39325 RepID=A0A7J7LRJ5_9MAGN|nr:hypothetical protein GIB67_041432 [Kingdonia uniflora]